MRLDLIGDVHGNVGSILSFINNVQDSDYVIQLGDWGAGFGAEELLDYFPERFFVLSGNHDNYDVLARYPQNLGRFGVKILDGVKIFFVCGAWSIDQQWRTPGLSWWESEQLNFKECADCLDLWESECHDVDLVISHDGPFNAISVLLGETPIDTNTGRLLYEMWKIHQPPLWRFGHHHKAWRSQIGGTDFRCLNIDECETLEFDSK